MEGAEGGNEKKESLVERKRQEAFVAVCEELDARLGKGVGKTFESHGREYEITSVEDAMVAFAQGMREEVVTLREEIVAKNDYREEQAIAKLLELFKTNERLIALYAELRSYYPRSAGQVEAHIPSLTESLRQAEAVWDDIKAEKE